jgi:hypothetical protein
MHHLPIAFTATAMRSGIRLAGTPNQLKFDAVLVDTDWRCIPTVYIGANPILMQAPERATHPRRFQKHSLWVNIPVGTQWQ